MAKDWRNADAKNEKINQKKKRYEIEKSFEKKKKKEETENIINPYDKN